MSGQERGQLADGHNSGRVIGLLRPHAGRVLTVLGLLVILALLDMAPPYAIKLLIDDVFAGSSLATVMGGRWRLLALILGGLFLSYVARNSVFFWSRMLSLRASEDVCFSLRKRLFDHLQQMGPRFYSSNQPGNIGARVMDDTYKVQTFIQDKFPLLMLNLLRFQILLVVICLMNIRLALAAVAILPLQFVAFRFFRAPIRQSHSEAQENLSLAYGSLVEKFLGMEVVKGFSGEARESEVFNRAIDRSRQSQIRSQRFHFAQKVTADLLVGAGTIMLIAYGAFEVINGRMLGGEFMMFFGYVMMLYPAVLKIIGDSAHLSKATASVNRVFEMLDEPALDAGAGADPAGETADASVRITRGAVRFRGVCFGFDDSSVVLHDFNLDIRAGERVAIVGPSGAGKSTAIRLLPRLITPTHGSILIDGTDTASIPVSALRASIGIAFQEVFLFNASIYENLRYAREDATLDEIRAACRVTGIDHTLERLPMGYETRLSDFGAELSRGEKQRITLARALLKDSRILIFDEATASIDPASSHAVMGEIVERMRDRTIILVTHDMGLLDHMDRVVCIRDGRIRFDGVPRDFLASDPEAFPASPVRLAFPREARPQAREHQEAWPDQPPSSDRHHPHSTTDPAGGVRIVEEHGA